MLTSLAFIFIIGLSLAAIFKLLKLPGLIGMLITGIVLGPYALNLLDKSILTISSDLRQLALIIILARAGLALDFKDLAKVGRPAILMCFLPACLEIVAVILIAPKLFGFSIPEAAIMGAVIAAGSPAVIVPKMLHLIETRYGTAKKIPQMIMAGATVDGVVVIVLFTVFIGINQGQTLSAMSFSQIPVSILTGLVLGVLTGLIFSWIFKKIHVRDSTKVLVILGISFLLVAAEQSLKGIVPFSGLLAVMSMGVAINKIRPNVAQRLSDKFSKLWVGAEVLLFVLVGATVDIKYALSAGIIAVIVIFGALAFRMAGVVICTTKTGFSKREKAFCMIAYIPKATVQAAIGSIPLAMGLACGQSVITVAVLAILITAPLGAIGIDFAYKRLLHVENINTRKSENTSAASRHSEHAENVIPNLIAEK